MHRKKGIDSSQLEIGQETVAAFSLWEDFGKSPMYWK